MLPFGGGKADEARQGAGDGDNAEDLGPEPRRLARSSRARQRALLRTRGKGCAGSMEMGVRSGSTSR